MESIIRKLPLLVIFIFFVNKSEVNAQSTSDSTYKYFVDAQGRLYWNKKLPVYLKISTSPGDSGILLQSEETKEYANPYYFDTEGKNRIRTRWATDQKTKKAVVPETEVIWEIYVDGIPPVSELVYTNSTNYADGENTIYGEGLKIEIKAVDENSDIDKVFYSLNDEKFIQYTTPFNVDKEGLQIIKYYAIDKVGNVEQVNEKKFSIDQTPPKTYYNITGISDGEVIAISTKIYLSAEDSISGLSKTYFKIDDEPEKIYTKGNYIPISHLKDGEHKLHFYSIDKVGNKESENIVSFYLDLTAPLVASDVLGDRYVLGDKIFFSGRTKMKLTAVDNKAGVDNIFYSVDGAAFEKYDQPFYLPNIPGIHIVKYYATDKMQNNSEAGNSKYEEYKHVVNRIYVDLTGPILSYSIIGPTFKARDTLFISNRTTLKFGAVDAESGVQSITYSLNKEPDETTYKEPFSIQNEGYQQVVYYGYDNVKNRNRAEFFVYVDGKGPDIKYNFSIVPQGNKDGLPVYPQHVNLYLGATDQIIGAKEIYYSINKGPEKKYSLSISGFAKSSVNIVNIRALDLLGNETQIELQFYVE